MTSLNWEKNIRKPIFHHCDHNDQLLTLNQASLQSRRHYQSALVGFHLANQTAHNTSRKFVAHAQALITLFATITFQLSKANSTLFQSSPLYFASHILTSCQSTFNHPHDYLNLKRRNNNTFSHHPALAQCTPSHPFPVFLPAPFLTRRSTVSG